MSIGELAKELGVTGKEVLAFLQEKDYPYKSTQKKLDAEEEALVRKQFGKAEKKSVKEEKSVKEDKSASKTVKEEKTVKKEEKTAKEEKAVKEEKTAKTENAVKEEKSVKAENAGKEEKTVKEEKPAKAENPHAEEAKKEPAQKKIIKKNIIFVGNPQLSKMGGGHPAQKNSNNRMNPRQPMNQGGGVRPTGPSSLIRPTTPPSPTPAKNFVPSNNNTGKSNAAPETKQINKEAAAPSASGTASVKTDAPASVNADRESAQSANRTSAAPVRTGMNQGNGNRGGNAPAGGRMSASGERDRNRNQGFGRGNMGQGGFGKDKDSDERSSRDNRFKKGSGRVSFAGDAPQMDEKHRDDEKRRISQEKDNRKNKKDYIYEEDGAGKGKGKGKLKPGAFIKPEKKVEEKVEEDIKVIVIPESLTIKELADKMKQQPAAIIKKLFLKGEVATLNQEISFEKAEEIAMEYEILCEKEEKVDVIEELLKEEEEEEAVMTERPPVICVMGHVDHGKTSLLDAIRKTHVIDREAGGITQHIGAYMVKVQDRKITFLDTPGHEAFTAMRMRGANATDIAILVVAADDGVMPQTKEAINHAKAAGVQIIVAVNKVDKIGYDFNDPSRKMDSYPSINNLMQELATEHNLICEDWGGTTIFAPVSAKKGDGIDELLDMILLSADMLELKANKDRKARGLVIEAQLDKGRGPVATVLVQKGTLRVGDFISAGASHGKVRAMIDDTGRRVKEATPSTPVEILGLNDVPNAGEIFIAHANDKDAKYFADTFIKQNKEKLLSDTKAKISLEDLFTQIQAGSMKELNLIVKADVQGSVEAVKQSLEKLSNEEIAVKVIHNGVGTINESDVILASAAKAIIIGFNVRLDNKAKDTVEKEAVDVRLYNVIYQAIEDVEAAMKGMLDPIFEEKILGHAEVRQIFKASQIGNIAGAYVLDGVFQRDCSVRITREGEQIFEGKLASLKRFKDDVKEVKTGFECGLVFEGFDKMQELDIVEAYTMVEVPR